MQKGKLIKGALWLTLTGTALRLVGMAYRIYISGKLGEAGMGLYQLILSVYMFCTTLSTAGVSVAVTRLISEESVTGGRNSIKKVMRFCLWWSTALAALVAVVLIVGAPLISARLLHSPQSATGLRILAVGLPFMAAAAVFNGYFLARSRVQMSCAAQVAEQGVRILVVASCIDRYAALGTVQGCNAVFLGNAISEVTATVLLAIFYLLDLRKVAHGGVGKSISARFLSVQLPVAAGRYIVSLLHTVENILVPGRLTKYGGDRTQALADFGALKGMAMPLIMFPSSFLSSLAGLLIPEITAAAALRQQKKISQLTHRTLHITLTFSILLGGIFYRFAGQLGQIIYHSRDVGTILKFLAPVIPFMYLDCITDGLLKGIGQQMASLRYCTADSLLRIALVFLLLHRYGLRGFLVVMAVSNISVALLGLRRLIKVTECSLPFKKGIVLPVVAAILANIVSSPVSSLPVAGILYFAVYLLFLLFSGGLTLRDLKPSLQP